MPTKKTIGKLKKQLQPIFNKFIRLRDMDKPCISCGKSFDDKDAGHFFPTGGYDGLRFDEDNVHGECKRCNRFDDAHLIFYAPNLKERIGEQRYHDLCAKADNYKAFGNKFARYDLEEKLVYYKAKVKELED